jgi:hypothetical protein
MVLKTGAQNPIAIRRSCICRQGYRWDLREHLSDSSQYGVAVLTGQTDVSDQ